MQTGHCPHCAIIIRIRSIRYFTVICYFLYQIGLQLVINEVFPAPQKLPNHITFYHGGTINYFQGTTWMWMLSAELET